VQPRPAGDVGTGSLMLGLRRPPPIRQLLGLAGIVRLPKKGRLQRRRRQPDLPIHLDLAPPKPVVGLGVFVSRKFT
jgi:hypothetical protein